MVGRSALGMQTEFAHSVKEHFTSGVWLIGDDSGDLVYFYGPGKDACGVYLAEAGSPGFENACNIRIKYGWYARRFSR